MKNVGYIKWFSTLMENSFENFQIQILIEHNFTEINFQIVLCY